MYPPQLALLFSKAWPDAAILQHSVARTALAPSSSWRGSHGRLYGDNFDELFDPDQIACTAGVQPRRMSVGGGRNEEIHHPSARLASHRDDRSSQLPVAGGHSLVHGQSGELSVRPPRAICGSATRAAGIDPGRTVRSSGEQMYAARPECPYLAPRSIVSSGNHRLANAPGPR